MNRMINKLKVKQIVCVLFLFPLSAVAESDLNTSAMDLANALQQHLKENGNLEDFSLSEDNVKKNTANNSKELIKNTPLQQEKYSDWSESDPAFEFVFRKSFGSHLRGIWSGWGMGSSSKFTGLVRETSPRNCNVRASAVTEDGYVEKQWIFFSRVNWNTIKIVLDDYNTKIVAECVDDCMYEDRVHQKSKVTWVDMNELEWDSNGFRNSGWRSSDTFQLLGLRDYEEASRYHKALDRIAELCPQSTSAY